MLVTNGTILTTLVDPYGYGTGFYSARNARIASAVLATAIPSVRLSVSPSVCLSVTRRYCVKTTARSTMQFTRLIAKGSSFVGTKKYSPGTNPSPEILAPSDLPTPEGSEF